MRPVWKEIFDDYHVSGLSGQTVVYDHRGDRTLDERRDHKKYVVKIATCEEDSTTWVATVGWDAKIFLYQIIDGNDLRLGRLLLLSL